MEKAEQFGLERTSCDRPEDELLREIARCKAKLKYDQVQKYDQATLTGMIAKKEEEFQEKTAIYENLKSCIFTVSFHNSQISGSTLISCLYF